MGPLKGIKVIDLTSMVSGPMCSMILADLGAEVIKVEPIIGDQVRHMATPHNGVNAPFYSVNRGKKSLAIDLKSKEGKEILLKLTEEADVFMQNFRPGAIERMGLGEDVVRRLQPKIIYVSISGFGETGPYSGQRVYDPIIQAISGLADIQRDRESGQPKMVRTIIPDKTTSVTAAQAITAALLHRERTGEGQHVRLSMLDTMIAFLWPEGMSGLNFVGNEVDPGRTGQQPGTWWFLVGCNAIVFVTSLCIMTLELSATRLLAHHIGQSLYTWTSVIGVVLAGITVGNFIGGILADRFDHRSTLGWLLLIASIHCFGVIWLDQSSIDWFRTEPPMLLEPFIWLAQWILEQGPSDQASWPVWIFAQVAVIYGPPAAAMGTVSPVVAALALSRSRRTGVTVGNVYAWGTLGSIIGTFLAGFLLIDLFGTRALVTGTAMLLGVTGVCAAASGSRLRPAIAFGWLQFLVVFGLAAAVSGESLDTAGGRVGELLGTGRDAAGRLALSESWSETGQRVGYGFHQFGQALSLRDDEPGRYEDESNYSYITVVETTDEDVDLKYLKLDKLVHSYYVPDNPTLLKYEYELVYAAATERARQAWAIDVTVELPEFPGRDQVVKRLSGNLSFSGSGGGRLRVRGTLLPADRNVLLKLSPSGAWWLAIEELYEVSTASDWVGFTPADLETLPPGVSIPDRLKKENRDDADQKGGIEFHPKLGALTTEMVIDESIRDELLAATPDFAWFQAVNQLYARSRQVRTMFIGGGGFVFPRWIEAKFPHEPVIDVAELGEDHHQAPAPEAGHRSPP